MMKHGQQIKVLFLDLGGVVLTNGWDRHSRESAAHKFEIDLEEMNKRHSLFFDTYEIGKLTLDQYLDHAVFNVPRNFTKESFKAYMFIQSQPFPDMLRLIAEIKKENHLRVVAVNNEGRELMDYRIKEFQLNGFIDFFVSSGYVGLRKPDHAIFELALDLAHVLPKEVIYIDDREPLIEVGKELGLNTIHHKNFNQTKMELDQYLSVSPKVS